jgi:hypothetical protein
MHVPDWGRVQFPLIRLKNQRKVYAELSAHILRIVRGEYRTEAEITRYNLRMECGECISTSARTGLTSIGT